LGHLQGEREGAKWGERSARGGNGLRLDIARLYSLWALVNGGRIVVQPVTTKMVWSREGWEGAGRERSAHFEDEGRGNERTQRERRTFTTARFLTLVPLAILCCSPPLLLLWGSGAVVGSRHRRR
jgi:hypothetical protein